MRSRAELTFAYVRGQLSKQKEMPLGGVEPGTMDEEHEKESIDRSTTNPGQLIRVLFNYITKS